MKRLLVLSALVFAMSACGDDADTDANAAADSAAPQERKVSEVLDAAGAVPPSKDTTIPAGAIGDATQSVTNILVELSETSAKVSHDTIAPGQTTVIMENKGTQPHSLEVMNPNGGRWRTIPAQPGSETSVTMVLPRGTYDVYCPMTHNGKPHKSSASSKFEVK